MGLRDKLTDLREQAQQAVAEHKDEIQGAMETTSAAVDQKTHGRYTDKISKYGQKATRAVEKFGSQASGIRASAHSGAAPNGVEMRVTRANRVSPTPCGFTVRDPDGNLVDVAQQVHSPRGRSEYRDLIA